jgi:hypothetical protein
MVLLATLALGACGERSSAPPPQQRGAFDAQLQALDKAKGVEKTLQDQAEAQRKALDEAERR